VILIRLLGMILEFEGAPAVDDATQEVLARYIDHPPMAGQYRDVLTLESMNYDAWLAEAAAPVHGASIMHIGHDDPTAVPRHVYSNVSWRTQRSNYIQRDLTIREARVWVVKVIARYFELGELEL